MAVAEATAGSAGSRTMMSRVSTIDSVTTRSGAGVLRVGGTAAGASMVVRLGGGTAGGDVTAAAAGAGAGAEIGSSSVR